jgi:hypothetical protein
VKSAYHLQKELATVHMAEGSDRGRNSEVWRTIWKLPIPNVEKNFFGVRAMRAFLRAIISAVGK